MLLYHHNYCCLHDPKTNPLKLLILFCRRPLVIYAIILRKALTHSNNLKYAHKDTTTMSNDNNLKGSGFARQNNIKHRDRAHPWHLSYLNTCIIQNCRTKPYYDGCKYFTCCFSCLREKELGPFYNNNNPRLIMLKHRHLSYPH